MINLKIGASERRFNNTGDIDESWINQQINGLKRDGQLSCIRLSINEGSVNLSLATIDCASSGGSNRPPNRDESRIFDLWRELGLEGKNFQSGNLIAFFKRVRHIIN